MVLWVLENGRGGEIFVPKIPSYRIKDLAEAIGPDCEHPVIGIRPGEKIHEEMITSSDSHSTVDLGRYYAILPSSSVHNIDDYCKIMNAVRVHPGFSYNSGSNNYFLSIDELRRMISEHLPEM